MKKRTVIISAAIATFAIAITGAAMARDHDKGMGHHGKAQAIAACANQSEGKAIVFNHPMWGNVNAVCGKTPDGQLAAMPAKMVEHMKQAVAVCVGKKDGDKVSLNDPFNAGQTLEAKCDQHGDMLMAEPKHMRRMMHKDL
ncbi:MAG: hypothetical protein ACRCV6_10040 [Formosimonas sp.]